MRFPWSSASRRVRHAPLLTVPFAGRDRLLQALDTHLQTVQEGTPHHVLLEGPAGSGKSALLTEFTVLRGHSARVFAVRVNASDCVLEHECAARLFAALQMRCEAILDRLYQDTKRVRKALAGDWDEAEFRTFLSSTDWAQLHELPRSGPRGMPERGDALTRLLALVQEHPWGIGAAIMLESLHRGIFGPTSESMWAQRWAELLRNVERRGVTSGAALVIVMDQLDIHGLGQEDAAQRWEQFWRTLVQATEAVSLPLLFLWAGTADNVAPVRRALGDQTSVSTYQLEALTADEQQQLCSRVQRALPRQCRQVWQDVTTEVTGDVWDHPGRLLLAASYVATQAETNGETAPQNLASVDVSAWVDHLVQASRRRQPVDDAVFRQFMETWAFLPPDKTCTIEDLLVLCHPETLGLDPVEGHTTLEALLGQWVRYGLIHYDVYATHYTTGTSLMQDAVRRWLYPNDAERQEVTERRRLAAALLAYVRQGDTAMLEALSHKLHAASEPNVSSQLEPYVVPSFRHLVRTMTKDERQQAAATLGAIRMPLVLEMVRLLLHDEEGQIRSRAVQSLSQLHGVDTSALLAEALRDSNSDVRWIAAQAVSQIEGAATVDALIPLLTDEDKEVGRIAAEGLGPQGDHRAVPHLIAALRDSYPLLRESAAVALGQLADRRALPALQELTKDTNQQVRHRAEEAVACFAISS